MLVVMYNAVLGFAKVNIDIKKKKFCDFHNVVFVYTYSTKIKKLLCTYNT